MDLAVSSPGGTDRSPDRFGAHRRYVRWCHQHVGHRTGPVERAGELQCERRSSWNWSHEFRAIYSGDANYKSLDAHHRPHGQPGDPSLHTEAQCDAVRVRSGRDDPGAALAATSPGTGTPTGNVTFFDVNNGTTTSLATATLNAAGVAAFTASSTLSVGTHNIYVQYTGDARFVGGDSRVLGGPAPTVTQTVSAAGVSMSVSTPPNPSVFGQNLSFTVTVSSPIQTPTGTVSLVAAGSTVGPVTLNATGQAGQAQATISTSTLPVGTHSLIFSYSR